MASPSAAVPQRATTPTLPASPRPAAPRSHLALLGRMARVAAPAGQRSVAGRSSGSPQHWLPPRQTPCEYSKTVVLLFECFPVFVPSLSWENNHLQTKVVGQNKPAVFSYRSNATRVTSAVFSASDIFLPLRPRRSSWIFAFTATLLAPFN